MYQPSKRVPVWIMEWFFHPCPPLFFFSFFFFFALTLYGPIIELCDATVTIKDTCFNYLLLSYNYGTQGLNSHFTFALNFVERNLDGSSPMYMVIVMAGTSISKCFHHSWFLYWFTLPLISPFLSSLLIFCLSSSLFHSLFPSLHLPSASFLLPHSHSLPLRFLKL